MDILLTSLQQPSARVAIIKFERGIQQGLLGRISRHGLLEYHGFGIISEGTESGCHCKFRLDLVISRAHPELVKI